MYERTEVELSFLFFVHAIQHKSLFSLYVIVEKSIVRMFLILWWFISQCIRHAAVSRIIGLIGP